MDGTSNTICFIEDAGRVNPHACPTNFPYQGTASHYSAPTTNPDGSAVGTLADAGLPKDTIANPTVQEPTAVWRWADEDACGSGVSGPANTSTANDAALNGTKNYDTAGNYVGKVINQNASPIGGPILPSTGAGGWTYNNIGLNDEPFSFHPGGCCSVFVDGSVHFLSESLDPISLRYMVTRAEGKQVNVDF